jgi:hypothetical protein
MHQLSIDSVCSRTRQSLGRSGTKVGWRQKFPRTRGRVQTQCGSDGCSETRCSRGRDHDRLAADLTLRPDTVRGSRLPDLAACDSQIDRKRCRLLRLNGASATLFGVMNAGQRARGVLWER